MGPAVRALVIVGAVACASALKVDLTVTKDTRRLFAIEEFGFLAGGLLTFSLSAAELENGAATTTTDPLNRAGIVFLRSDSEADLMEALREEQAAEYKTTEVGDFKSCPLDDKSHLLTIEIFHGSKFQDTHRVSGEEEGIYSVTYVHCGPSPTWVSFRFESDMVNPGPNHLTAGQTPLPTILFVFGLVFAGMLAAWISLLRKNKEKTNKIHHLLTAFMMLKVGAVFAEAIDLHYIKVNGSSMTWNILFHALSGLRAIMFFMVVILLGTGWSLLKPVLNEKERKVLLFVLPMQFFANLALVVSDGLAEGSTLFLRWRDIFQIVDGVCVFVVIISFLSQIQQLEQMTTIEHKAPANLAKLRQFRRFYFAVLSYIYMTRVMAFLISNSVNFKLQWLHVVFKESVAVIFYVYIASTFRPGSNDGHFRLGSSIDGDYESLSRRSAGGRRQVRSDSSDAEDDTFGQDAYFEDDVLQSEYGLRDESIEMPRR